jgi:mRNA interferase HicA
VKGAEFLRRLRALARTRGVAISFDKKHGKGSHGTLYFGSRRTTLKDLKKEIGIGLQKAMLSDLGLAKDEFDQGE